MDLQKIDLNLFPVFQVIYETGSITRAAEQLNKSQPAVSNALARLRDLVDDPLFIHVDKRMNPTARAEELIGPIRGALKLMQGSIREEQEFSPIRAEKVVRLSAGDIAETIIVPEFVKRLRAEAPNLSVQVFQLERVSIPTKLAANEVDFAIDIPMPLEENIHQIPLMQDHQVCAVSHNHPLASQTSLDLDDFLSCEHIHVSYRRRGGGVADIGLGRLGKIRKRVVRLQHHQAAFAMLDNTDLVLAAPSKLAALYNCKIFPLPFPAPSLDLQLYWHARAENSKLHAWLKSQLIAAAEAILVKES
ncbi:LysR family transcriptional regulator [Sneathiella limimaris]|uniref:LysR family transcriptional regulator n=1 Tax=Sneathiella limimaris TaxID=1964213 RepID=UPI00146A2B0C|nr:LysR family transcriptional regulator [Sneathiella limimaris]